MSAAPTGEGRSLRGARPRVPKGARPVFLDGADSERLLSMLLALAAEVSVLSDEVDTLRELLAEATVLAPDAAARFAPSAATRERRATRRRALIRRMLRIVLEDLDGPAADRRRTKYQALVRAVSR
jgi:hypothetical protein